MSSIRIDASGQRALTTSFNGPDATSATIPTKGDDNVSLQLGSVSGLEVIVPMNARLERRKYGSSEILVLVVSDVGVAGSLTAFGVQPEREPGAPSMWPHATLSIGKHLKNPWAGEAVEVVHERLGDLIPPTE